VKLLQRHANQSGFTLVELVMVVVILGILSAYALPRFADLGQEAKIAKLNALHGVIKSTAGIVTSVAFSEGIKDGSMNFEGNNVNIAGGHPTAQDNATFRYLIDFSSVGTGKGTAHICQDDWCSRGNQGSLGIAGATSNRNMVIWINGVSFNDNCYVWYHNGFVSGGDNKIASGVVSSGC